MVKKVTLRDVADAAGVSVTAASLVLNRRSARISEETRQQVLDAAKRLKYVPNQAARSLVTKRTQLITMIIPDIENLFFASLARCVEEICQQHNYSLIVANSDDSRETEHELLRQIIARGVDGLFLIPARESVQHMETLKQEIANVACPVTLIDRMVTAGWCDGVGFDNIMGGALAAQCLLEAGHTRIACIAGEGNASRRRQGFIDTLARAGVAIPPELDIVGNYKFDSGYESAQILLDNGATAAFCCNDLMAMGLLKRIGELGLQVPEDLSVIGYDNILERFGMPIEVTTIEQHVETLAEASCEMLLARIAEDHKNSTDEKAWLSSPQERLLEPKLIPRGTVGDIGPAIALN